MLKRVVNVLSVSVLVALMAACEKPTPYAERKTPEPEPEPVIEELSKEFLSAEKTATAMGAGWNLGNTLDAHSGDTTNMWIEGWGPSGISDYERAWGQVPPTTELFRMLRKAGFRSVRIPVTWYPHMSTDFNVEVIDGQPVWKPSLNPVGYTVDPAWMAEVKRVVDCVLEADMYCILNIHHDTGTANTHWLVASIDSYAQNSERYRSLWKQIAETFKGYDGRLLFESFNEMTDSADSWCYASYNTPLHYDAAIAASAYAAINAYAQDFVDVVRATGGNNANRNLIVNTYAAASGDGTWNVHLSEPLTEMALPKDNVQGHIFFQVHYYPEFASFNDGKKSVDYFLSNLQKCLASKGAPVIIGEWGVGGNSKVNYDSNRTSYLNFAEYFVEKAKSYGMATFFWMGISDGADRAVPKFTQEDLKDAIIRGIEK